MSYNVVIFKKMGKNTAKNIAIILAAGKSLRMQGVDKIETIVGGKPLIAYTVAPFLESKLVDEIVIACNNENISALKKIFLADIYKNIHFTIGGETRFQSAKNAFEYANKKFNLSEKSTIIFHNCGNVLATKKEIEDTIKSAKKHGACIVARPASDTLKKITPKNKIIETIDRKEIFYAETPQTFRVDILKNAYMQPIETTDESSLIERSGYKVCWTPASTFNRKITTQYDMAMTKMILEKEVDNKKTYYALGTDTHFFEKNKKHTLTLCGIKIRSFAKLAADSDGDVGIHALVTAISQGIGHGSLGTFATKLCGKGVKDSKEYVKYIIEKAKKNNTNISHIGMHFECDIPKIDPLVPRMKKSLSRIMGISETQINITATTQPLIKNGVRCTAIVTMR